MTRIVIDASVAAKWFLPSAAEELHAESVDLLTRRARGELSFLVPDFFFIEVAAVLWKAVRRGTITSDAAKNAVRDLAAEEFPAVRARLLVDDAIEIAINHERSVYDCVYVALAVRAKADMITADERLVSAIGSRFPVRWLGGWPVG